MSLSDFLACNPRELDGYFEQIRQRDICALEPAALICAVLCNIHRDPQRKPEPWKVEDFLPGAESDEENMRRFAEKVARGESFEDDPDAIRGMGNLKHEILNRFKVKNGRDGRN